GKLPVHAVVGGRHRQHGGADRAGDSSTGPGHRLRRRPRPDACRDRGGSDPTHLRRVRLLRTAPPGATGLLNLRSGRWTREGGRAMPCTMRALLLVGAAATVVVWGNDLRGQPAARAGGAMVVASFGGKFAQALDESYFQPFGRDAGVKVTMD